MPETVVSDIVSRAKFLEKIKKSNESLLNAKNKAISRRDTVVAVLRVALEDSDKHLRQEAALHEHFETAYKSEKKRRRGRFWIFTGGLAVGFLSAIFYSATN